MYLIENTQRVKDYVIIYGNVPSSEFTNIFLPTICKTANVKMLSYV